MRLFTDTHLGKRLRKHTTTASQRSLYDKLFEQAKGCIDPQQVNLLLGDLFDTFDNDECTIQQGINIARGCALILEGNHDRENVSNSVSSLKIVEEAVPETVMMSADPGAPCVLRRDLHEVKSLRHDVETVTFWMIPHCFTQSLFEQSVEMALEAGGKDDVLLLHCNVGDRFGQAGEADDASLTLTPELTEKVRSVFGLVLVGHEHVPRTMKAGKGLCELTILGNTMPLSFGEIAHRYCYDLDPKTLTLKKHLIWDATQEHVEIKVEEFLAREGDIYTAASMVTLSGEVSSDSRPALQRAKLRFWRENADTLLALNDAVEIIDFGRVRKVSVTNRTDVITSLRESAKASGFEKELELLMEEVGDDE